MGTMLAWWLAIEVMGLAALPICFRLFANLPDKGYLWSKALGLLLISYLFWLVGWGHLLPNARSTVLVLLLLLGLVSILLLRRTHHQLKAFVAQNWRLILVGEMVFLLSFVLWAVIRAYNPEIDGTEKPMDFAFLNGVLRSRYFPPVDPWLSGSFISYYYFGHIMVAVITKITAVSPSVAYNLALALFFALTAQGAFGLVYNLVMAHQKALSWKRATVFGLAGVLMLTLVANFEGVLELLHAHSFGSAGFWQAVSIKGLAQPYHSLEWYPTDHWWWWRSTRIIDTLANGRSLDYTITEFPFFSFLLGDLHPHLMALPFVLMALALSLNFLKSPEPLGWRWVKRHPLHILLVVLVLGGLGFLNSWDFPTYGLIFVAIIAVQRYLAHNHGVLPAIKAAGAMGGATILGGLILYLPFYLHLQTQASGILPLRGVSTRPIHYLLFWGLFLFISFSFILAKGVRALRERPISLKEGLKITLPLFFPLALWGMVELSLSLSPALAQEVAIAQPSLSDVLISLVRQLWHLLPMLAILGLGLLAFVRNLSAKADRTVIFVLILTWVGLFLTMILELFYIKDLFGNRMNTVFKVYYQSWVLLAIASAFGLYFLSYRWQPVSKVGRAFKGGWLLAFSLILVASILYAPAAILSKTNAFGGKATLDGLAFLKSSNPSEYEAIQWLSKNTKGTPVIVEATGPEYSQYGRISARTGLPTILGWAGHELQWRGSSHPFQGREEDVARIYQSPNQEEVRAILQKYQVSYVYVGSLERAKYGEQALANFQDILKVAYTNPGVTIFQVKGD
ncbi:MAG: hypothetical protein HY664_01710 [Chloroflexi bacterium]|nr:hypothetical protein [Chloroflexota bacterium]